MTATKSTKPSRPRPDFPLFPHASGPWAKKIKGRCYYFGPWSDPGAAETYFNRIKADLYAGRKPRPYDVNGNGVDVATACHKFLAAKQDLVDSGELKPRTWNDYYRTCQRIVRVLGRNRVTPDLRTALNGADHGSC